MSIVEVKLIGYKDALSKFAQLNKMGVDQKPTLTEWVNSYKLFIAQNWQYQGTPYGKRWKGLTKKYADWKAKQGKGRKANLILWGKLKKASTGGEGWFQNVSKKNISFGIELDVVPYARRHQLGDIPGKGTMPQRPYMMGKKGELPGKAYQNLVDIINRQWNKIVEKR